MIRLAILAWLVAATPTAAPAQPADPHAGHATPSGPAPDPHADHRAPGAPVPDPHAGHVATAPAAEPHPEHGGTGLQLPVGAAPAPPPASGWLADQVHGATAMTPARETLRAEHGGVRIALMMADVLEVRPGQGRDVYAWEGEFLVGGDVERLVLRTEGGGAFGRRAEEAEIQALYSRAIGPYFDLQAGVRQDIEPRPRRSYLTLGFDGLAPYWFEVEGAVFLSQRGEASARLAGSYDLRLSQRLIIEGRGEVNVAGQDTTARGIGAGVSDVELGLRLRYEIRRQIAPYVGVYYERKLGRTADFARADKEDVSDTRVVIGVRSWF